MANRIRNSASITVVSIRMSGNEEVMLNEYWLNIGNADILSGHKSTLLVQLGNIALRSGNTLHLDPSNGHIKNDPAAEKLWRREYQPGWEPKI